MDSYDVPLLHMSTNQSLGTSGAAVVVLAVHWDFALAYLYVYGWSA